MLVAAGLLVVIGVLGGLKFLQIGKLIAFGEEQERKGPPPEPVGTAMARQETWERTLATIGSVAGARSVEISNDSAGRVRRIRFESGELVKRGEVLVELDTSVERARIASLESQRELAAVTARRGRALVAEGVIAQQELDRAEAELDSLAAQIKAVRAEIEKKIVRAPFGGRLGIRAVDIGQYLPPGTRLTELESLGSVFVDFSLPQRDYAELAEGMRVRIAYRNGKKEVVDGAITAVEPKLDDQTRSVQLRSSVPSAADELRPGMFVDVSVVLPSRDQVVAVPATSIVHASYGDSVFVVELQAGKQIARQQFVRTGRARGDFVEIEHGVRAGQQVVSAGAFKLRNGVAVVVDNSVKPEPELEPKPENR